MEMISAIGVRKNLIQTIGSLYRYNEDYFKKT